MTALALALQKRVGRSMSRRNSYTTSKHLFYSLSLVIVILSVFYMFFIGKAVITAANRHILEVQTKQLASTVADLEANYMSSRKGIDMNLATSLGFEESHQPGILADNAAQSRPSARLSMNNGF